MRVTLRQRKLVALAGITGLLVLCAFALLPALEPPSNCGGNSAALTECRLLVSHLNLLIAERGGQPITIKSLSDEERPNFKSIWLGDAKILVADGPVSFDRPKSREIIAVCNTAFDNVPWRMFGKAPPAHAVAYSDGSTCLISTNEFSELTLSRFTELKSPSTGLKEARKP
jgi:hypothetical protein